GTHVLSGNSRGNQRETLVGSGLFFEWGCALQRSPDMTLLWCVNAKEAEEILEEIHEGTFGTYVSEQAMARKILRVGYY
ncbi:hypothetical protein CR513_13450, partial [Mucuna pruriens]